MPPITPILHSIAESNELPLATINSTVSSNIINAVDHSTSLLTTSLTATEDTPVFQKLFDFETYEQDGLAARHLINLLLLGIVINLVVATCCFGCLCGCCGMFKSLRRLFCCCVVTKCRQYGAEDREKTKKLKWKKRCRKHKAYKITK